MSPAGSASLSIGLVHPYAWPEVRRGGERYLEDLASFLVGRGHAVEIVAGTLADPGVETRADGVVVHRLRHRFGKRLSRRGVTNAETFGAVAVPTLARRRFDAVHAFMPTAAVASRLARRPTLFTLLGHPEPGAVAGRPVVRRLNMAAMRMATVSAALSAASAAAAREVFGREPRVIPPGVDSARFPPNLEPRRGPPRILFSGALDQPQKGLDVVVRAVASLLDRFPGLTLTLSGSGDPQWALSALGEDRPRVEAALEVLGPGSVDDVPGRYREATLTVLASRHEAFGLALVESLASGTPVVCARSGGMPELVDDELVGRVTPYGDVGALADAVASVVELAADPETPARCREHSARWDWETRVGPLHEDVYREIARGNP